MAWIALLLCWLGLPLAARAEGPEWTVGRTSEVFRGHGDGLATRVGGWFDASYEDNDRGSEERSINLNHLNLFFDTRFRDQWQVFLEVEFENESDLTGFGEERAYQVEQVYGRYRWSDNFQLQAGRFNTPFGFWTPVHWNILMDSVRPPIHEAQHVTPEQQEGFAVTGSFYPTGGRLSEVRYSLFTGFGHEEQSLDPREAGPEGWTGGADLRLGFTRGDFAGVSFYRQRRSLRDLQRAERDLSLYAKLGLTERLSLLGEYVVQVRNETQAREFERRLDIAYTTLHWQLHPKYYVSYRFNWGDNDLDFGTDTRYAHTVTLGFNPTRSLRVKLEYADHSFRGNRRGGFRYWAASIGGLF